ncbi:uncharacterized protein DDB_G0292186-like [Phymastichus coffea]|uniref:uncharacterized protein DDB_G0292186-like n=1 Tax=Phymastichus coffea TaxID=108790 RepID=UPI00273B3972|nr:uncharacterized protein DDB_G0292186-like [Phymastichus coffea]
MNSKSVENDYDSDSIISDNSIASITEILTRKASIETIFVDSSSSGEEEDLDIETKNGGEFLQEEKFVVDEIVEEIQEKIVKKHEDKATQTYDNEFLPKAFNRIDNTLKASTTNTLGFSEAMTSGPNQCTLMETGSVSASIATSAIISTSTRVTSNRNNQNFNNNSIRNKNHVRNNVVRTKRTYNRIKSYKNYRVQPYRYYNNYYNSNKNRSYYRKYCNGYNNNYYKRNYNYSNNRYGTAYYNNNYRYNNVPRYRNQFFTYQFKERLFRGFIELMDYIFDYDYSQDVRY